LREVESKHNDSIRNEKLLEERLRVYNLDREKQERLMDDRLRSIGSD